MIELLKYEVLKLVSFYQTVKLVNGQLDIDEMN